jgi:hypothetical protein
MPFASGKSILKGLLGKHGTSKFDIVGSGEGGIVQLGRLIWDQKTNLKESDFLDFH